MTLTSVGSGEDLDQHGVAEGGRVVVVDRHLGHEPGRRHAGLLEVFQERPGNPAAPLGPPPPTVLVAGWHLERPGRASDHSQAEELLPVIFSGFFCMTTHGPASMTVTGTTWLLLDEKTCVMPSFLPINPMPLYQSPTTAVIQLNFHINAGGKIKLHERIDGLLRRLRISSSRL